MGTWRIASIVLLAAWSAGGCGAGSGQGPRATLLALSADLRAGRYAQAYARMDVAYRRRVPFERFVAHYRAHPDEVAELADLARQEPERLEAVVDLGDGDELTLTWEDGAWRVVGRTLDVYDRSSPRAAVRAFVRALERRRWDLIWEMAPRTVRAGTTPQDIEGAWQGRGEDALRRWVAALREALDGPIERRGDVASVSYGGGRLLRLVREEGLWCIEEPDG